MEFGLYIFGTVTQVTRLGTLTLDILLILNIKYK